MLRESVTYKEKQAAICFLNHSIEEASTDAQLSNCWVLANWQKGSYPGWIPHMARVACAYLGESWKMIPVQRAKTLVVPSQEGCSLPAHSTQRFPSTLGFGLNPVTDSESLLFKIFKCVYVCVHGAYVEVLNAGHRLGGKRFPYIKWQSSMHSTRVPFTSSTSRIACYQGKKKKTFNRKERKLNKEKLSCNGRGHLSLVLAKCTEFINSLFYWSKFQGFYLVWI